MKRNKIVFSIFTLMLIGSMLLVSCSNDEEVKDLSLESLVADDIDLNTATAPVDVPTDVVIIAKFSTDIDPATANGTNILLTRDYDNQVIAVAIDVSGSELTITPSGLTTGTLFELNVGSGLASIKGKSLAGFSRTFTTEGTFAPQGAVAQWLFEGNGDDETGTYSAAESSVIDVSYATGRNAASGQAAVFNGSTSIIEIPNGTNLANTTDFAMSIWIAPDSSAHHGGNFVVGAGGYNGFEFEINKNDAKMAAQYAISDGTSLAQDLWLDGTGNLGWQGWTYSKDLAGDGGFATIVNTPDTWSHFVFMYNSTTKVGSIYLNGVLVKAQDFNLWPAEDAIQDCDGLTFNAVEGVGTNMAIGFYSDRSSTAYPWADYNSTDANHYAGMMDDLIVFHRVLTEQEISLMYQSGK